MGEVEEKTITKNCQNCDFEYYCHEHKEEACLSWRADLDYKRMMESGKAYES